MTRRDRGPARIPALPRVVRAASLVLATVLAAACGSTGPAAGPAPGPVPRPGPAPAPAPVQGPNAAGAFAGFDTGLYPGDDALRAWRQSSPYLWVGYYLPAPCHRDVSWSGKRDRLIQMGWGTAVIYLGQQDWAASPGRAPAAPDT